MRIAPIAAVIAAALLTAGCDRGPKKSETASKRDAASNSEMASDTTVKGEAPFPELEGKWSSKFIASMSKQPGCSLSHVTFEKTAVQMTAKGQKPKDWMMIIEATKNDGKIRLKIKDPKQNKVLVLYLTTTESSIRLADMRDESDSQSLDAAMKNVPPEMKGMLAGLMKGVTEMMEQMFALDRCDAPAQDAAARPAAAPRPATVAAPAGVVKQTAHQHLMPTEAPTVR
jgi:hypothetical protein